MKKEEIDYFCKNVKIDYIQGQGAGDWDDNIRYEGGSFTIGWDCKDIGFGQMKIQMDKKGKITAELETFDKKMLRAVLNKIVRKCGVIS